MPHIVGLWLQLMCLALLETADRLPFQAGSGHSVRMTCREKGGSQSKFPEYIGYRSIMNLENIFLSKRRSYLP